MLIALIACLIDPLVADRADIDRGAVRVGPALVQEFTLTNASDRPVELTGARSTCGCLAPKLSRSALAPGESATLTVDVNTLSQPAGPVAWTTRVAWKSGDRTGELPLTLRANLFAEVRVEPASLAFFVRRARSADVTVTDTRARPLRITAAGASVPGVEVAVVPGADPRTQTLRVTAVGELPPGTVQGAVWFTTDDPAYPQVRVPLSVQAPARTRVQAAPSTLFLHGVASGRALLRDSQGEPVRIARVDVDGPFAATVEGACVVVRRLSQEPAGARLAIQIAAPQAETVVVTVDAR